MKGPSKPNILIVEDEKDARENYEEIFKDLKREPLEFVGPKIVSSFEEAITALTSINHYHVAILDLSIPEKKGRGEGQVNRGLALVQRCIERDDKPIPSVLIITGHIDNEKQSEYQDLLPREFVFGKSFSKSVAKTEAEIRRALERVNDFLKKGIEHENDVEITPREDYLACRVAMETEVEGFHLSQSTDVQLAYLDGSPFTGNEMNGDGSKKILIARPMLSDGEESAQRYHFVFMNGDSDRLDVVERRAKQWANKKEGCSNVRSYRSNNRALFFFSLLPSTQAGTVAGTFTESNSIGRTSTPRDVMRRKKKVVRLIEAHGPTSTQSELIADLRQLDETFKELDVEYVREVMQRCEEPEMKAAYLTLHVGAFKTEGVESDPKRRRAVSKTFYEAVRRAD